MISRLSGNLERSFWKLWTLAVDRRKHFATLYSTASQRVLNRRKKNALATWRESARQTHLYRRVLSHLINAKLAAAWLSWVEAVSELRENKRKMLRCASYLTRRGLVVSFECWIRYVTHRARTHEAIARVLKRHDHRTLNDIFGSWAHSHTQEAALVKFQADMMAIRNTDIMQRVLTRWQWHSHTEQRVKRFLDLSAGAKVCWLQACTLMQWQQAIMVLRSFQANRDEAADAASWWYVLLTIDIWSSIN
jgi:hypothetical protein